MKGQASHQYKKKNGEKKSHVYEYLTYDNGATQGEMPDCLADGAGKTEYTEKQ